MINLLKDLCLAFGPAAQEEEVREIIIKNLDADKNDFYVDRLGNLVVTHKGKKQEKKVGFYAYMDEASLIAQYITDDGFVKFMSVGAQKENLPAKAFYCKDEDLYAVVSGKTWHTSSQKERHTQVDVDGLYIDFAAKDKEQAMKHVRPADQFVYEASFRENMDGSFSCKAMERSASCLALLNALNSDVSKEFIGIFAAGGKESDAALIVPAKVNDLTYGIILEAMGAGDNPFCPDNEKTCEMGKGFNICYSEEKTVYDKSLVTFITNKAEEHNIAYQRRTLSRSTSYARPLVGAGNGCKAAVLGLPVEYPNCPSTTVFGKDIENAEAIIKVIAEEIDSL